MPRCRTSRGEGPEPPGVGVEDAVPEAMERLYFLAKVEKGLQEADGGKLVSHGEVRNRFSLVGPPDRIMKTPKKID